MKKKLSKQKRKLFLSIILSMFLLSIVVFITIAVSILNNEKQRLEADAYADFNSIVDDIQGVKSVNTDLPVDYYLNDLQRDMDIQVKIADVTNTNDVTEKVVAQTRNAIAVNFFDEVKINYFGLIDFNEFRGLFTEEQYKTICDYLKKEADKDNGYYILVCTEFYYGMDVITPKTVEVVYTKPEHDWYAQDKVIEHYELNPTVPSNTTLYKSPGDLRNIINMDFVLGKFEVKPLLDKVDEFYKTFDPNEYQDTNKNDPFPLRTGIFEYLIYYNDYAVVYNNADINADNADINADIDEMQIYDFSQPKYYDVRYAKEINILEGCVGSIIMMFIYIFGLFLIVGVIIGAISWHTLKKQIEQEQRLRTVTNAMAHELKTPLFIIGGYCDNLMENINADKKEHYAYVISQKTQEMNELVVKMLDYSKFDSASFKPKLEEFNITELTREIVSNYELYDIKFEYDKEAVVKADKKLITSVIENFVDNAIKYTTDVERIKVSIKNGKFSISNPCEELTKADIDKMWQPYHRNADNSDKEGFGLGLAIVKSIFEMHHVKYRAEYSDGLITFEFNLPK